MAELFLEFLKMSLIGTLFAVAVMAMRLAFRKAPKWIFVVLWGVVALRLILPISLESRISLVPDSLATGEVITHMSDAYVGPVEIIYEAEPAYRDALEAGGQPVHSEQGNYIVTQKDTVETPKTFGETVLPVLGWVWLAGVALMLLYTAGSYLLLKRKMAVATLLEGNIWQCEKADMPFVLGVFRPKIYLPYGIPGEDFDYVIAHEQAHIARRDHLWKPLGFFLLSVHWFNPVLWVVYILLCRDIEAACDEKVITPMDKAHMRAYSTALLNCSVHRRRIAACPLAFGETGVKERIRRIMNYKKPTFWITLIAMIIAAAIIVCFCTDPVKKEQNPGPTETTATEQTENNATEQTENNGNNETNTATGEPQQSAVTLTHKASFVRGEKSELTGAANIGYGELLDYESCQAFFNRGITNNSLSYSKEFFEDHSLLLLSVPRGSGSAIMAVREIKYKDSAVYCFLEYPTNRDVVMTADMAYWYCLIEVDTVLPEGTRVMFYSENVEYDLDAYQQKQQQFNEQRVK